jgi:hypothetical protein
MLKVKFQILLTLTGDCFLLECDAMYLGQMGTKDSEERVASIFRLGKKMGAALPLPIYMALHSRRKQFSKHVIPYLYNLPKILN